MQWTNLNAYCERISEKGKLSLVPIQDATTYADVIFTTNPKWLISKAIQRWKIGDQFLFFFRIKNSCALKLTPNSKVWSYSAYIFTWNELKCILHERSKLLIFRSKSFIHLAEKRERLFILEQKWLRHIN